MRSDWSHANTCRLPLTDRTELSRSIVTISTNSNRCSVVRVKVRIFSTASVSPITFWYWKQKQDMFPFNCNVLEQCICIVLCRTNGTSAFFPWNHCAIACITAQLLLQLEKTEDLREPAVAGSYCPMTSLALRYLYTFGVSNTGSQRLVYIGKQWAKWLDRLSRLALPVISVCQLSSPIDVPYVFFIAKNLLPCVKGYLAKLWRIFDSPSDERQTPVLCSITSYAFSKGVLASVTLWSHKSFIFPSCILASFSEINGLTVTGLLLCYWWATNPVSTVYIVGNCILWTRDEERQTALTSTHNFPWAVVSNTDTNAICNVCLGPDRRLQKNVEQTCQMIKHAALHDRDKIIGSDYHGCHLLGRIIFWAPMAVDKEMLLKQTTF